MVALADQITNTVNTFVAGGGNNSWAWNNTVVGDEPSATIIQALAVRNGIIEGLQLCVKYIGGKGMDTMTV